MDIYTPYELRAELRGHAADVRGTLACDLGIVTASRDKTLRLWVSEGPSDYTCLTTYAGHTDYVGPIAYMPAGASGDYVGPNLVSGSRDTTVKVWDTTTAQAVATLQGHVYQVTALGVLPSGDIVSGALDKTLRVWKNGKCRHVLEGHDGPVLCIVVLPSGDVLSGSGDATIKQWQGATCIKTITGHTDTVRGLAVLPGGAGFVSGSHDMTCKVWSIAGEVLAELVGHTALVYSVAATEGGFIASGSEDNTMRVWSVNGTCLQVVEHVGCIWDVHFTPDGDLISGCADAVARVWTRRQEHKGPAELAAAFTQSIASVKEQRAAAAADHDAGAGGDGAGGGAGGVLPPGVKVEEAFTLQQPGTKDGQTKIVKEADGSIWAYSWDVASWQWERIGEVVPPPSKGAAGGGTIKKYHLGKEWDFVFDVDVGEGLPPQKIALNRDDNPYVVAAAFIEQHELPAYFKEQIVQFIITNTGMDAKPATAGLPITGGFCDPFTGGGSSSSAPAPGPYPSAPPVVPLSSLPVTGGFLDPFTGGGSSSSAPPPPAAAATFLVFDNVPPMDKLSAKVRELSGQLGSSMDSSTLALTEQEAAGVLDGLLATASAAAQASAPSLTVTPDQAALLNKMLTWPAAQLFPALDVARLLALHPTGASILSSLTSDFQPLGTALKTAAAASGATATQQTALRLVANAFKQPALRQWVGQAREGLLDGFASTAGSTAKAVRLSWATLLYNYVVLVKQSGAHAGEEAKMQVLSALVELLTTCPLDDADSAARALTAVSMQLSGDKGLAEIAKDLGLQDVLKRIHDAPESRTPAGRPVLEAAIRVTATLK